MQTTRPRFSPLRMLRAIWRYRKRIEAHGDRYHQELATAVHTALREQFVGRAALGTYRLAMRLLVVGAIVAVLVALLGGTLLYLLHPLLTLVAIVPLVGAGLLTWWRIAWGAPLDWLQEHADPTRELSFAELPGRLHELARETRTMADVPARLADELDALAAELEQSTPS